MATPLALLAPCGCDRGPSGTSVVNANAPATPATQPTAEELDAARRALSPRGATPPAAAPAQEIQLPPGHPPLPSAGSAPSAAAVQAAPLQFDAPKTWEKQTASGMSRVAQYRLPTTAEGQEPPELVVTVFPKLGQMADPDPNIERWRNQFVTPDMNPLPPEAVQRSDSTIGGMPATTVRMTGRYAVSPMMGGTGKLTDVDYRMLATMIVAPEQVYFFKLTGPEPAVRAAEADFEKMLETIRVE